MGGREARAAARVPGPRLGPPALFTLAALCFVMMACGRSADSTSSAASLRAGLERYVQQVEPIRLAVNRLLEGADPIIGAFHEHRMSPAAAGRRMNGLERRFAALTLQIASLQPVGALSQLHAQYAQTYVLEDAYLSALASGLSRNDLSDLPDTQSQQRAAIISWRIGLAVLALRVGVALPQDLELAGRGEIAPAARGAS